MKPNVHRVEQGAQALTFEVPQPIVFVPAERMYWYHVLSETDMVGRDQALNGCG